MHHNTQSSSTGCRTTWKNMIAQPANARTSKHTSNPLLAQASFRGLRVCQTSSCGHVVGLLSEIWINSKPRNFGHNDRVEQEEALPQKRLPRPHTSNPSSVARC